MSDLDGVSLNELNTRACILEMVIRESEGDPRLPEPIRQLEIIRQEIRTRLNMGNFDSLKTPEIERRRALLQASIEKENAEFMELGRILDARYRADALAQKVAKLEAEQAEVMQEMTALENAAEVPPAVVVKMRPIISKIFGNKAG